MKNLLYSFAFITLCCSLTSCTADEIKTDNALKIENTPSVNIVEIDPPIRTLPPPPKN